MWNVMVISQSFDLDIYDFGFTELFLSEWLDIPFSTSALSLPILAKVQNDVFGILI